MKERPILFNGAMVQAILEGRKTQTRRALKNPHYYGCPTGDCPHALQSECDAAMNLADVLEECPFGKPGDRLYVRESAWIYGQWIKNGFTPKGRQQWKFKIIGQQVSFEKPGLENIAYFGSGPGYTFRPSIHTPRWASRITLEIVSVRVERLNQISEADAYKEGCNDDGRPYISPFGGRAVVNNFAALWGSVYGPGSFDDRWVWVVEFKRI